MTRDRNKGIDSITYNHLNLPSTISINGTDSQGNSQSGIITYVYDATGMKLEKIVSDNLQQSTISTQYSGAYIYEDNNGNEQLKMISHPEGYIEPVYNTTKSISKFSIQTQSTSSSNYQYVYQYKDHLGNVRLTYADTDGNGSINPSDEIISEKNYYPFGLQHKGYNDVVSGNVNSVANRFGFGNKENNPELGLEWMDFGVRNYDASLGRWMNLDPLAESFLPLSPYNYAANSPLYFIDPDGAKIQLADIFDSASNLETGINLLLDLSEQTGLSLTLDGDGFVSYETDDGNAIVEEREGVQLGSEDARNQIVGAIDHDDTVSVYNALGGSRVPGSVKDGTNTNTVRLDSGQIGSQIASAQDGLNNKTLGYGLTFLHELGHTRAGGSFDDTRNGLEKGPTVERINRIRQQLDANPLNKILGGGAQYGIRNIYGGLEVDRKNFNSELDVVTMVLSFSILNKNGEKQHKGVGSVSLKPKKE